MGEVLPYSDRELSAELDRAVLKGLKRLPYACILTFEKSGNAFELEIRTEADVLEGHSQELSVYLRERRSEQTP